MSNLQMILCVTPPGEDFTIAEISERVNDRFGPTSRKSLENMLNRSVKRGEFTKQSPRGAAQRLHPLSLPMIPSPSPLPDGRGLCSFRPKGISQRRPSLRRNPEPAGIFGFIEALTWRRQQ